MISSNLNSKINAPKSARDGDSELLDESDGFQRVRLNSNSRNDSISGEARLHSTVIFSQKDGRVRTRPRPNSEFRSTRGDRRGTNIRSRGLYPGKSDRDNAENPRRYHEPFIKNQVNDLTSNNSFNSGKYFDAEAKLVSNLPEDPRISKLLRRLCAETDTEKSSILCSKLQEAVMLPDNMRYVRRSYDILAESLLDVLYGAPSLEAKEQAALVLGRIGYVMGTDYNKHLDWIFGRYTSQQSDDVKMLLLKSLNETHLIDTNNPILDDFASEAMQHLQLIIESTDTPKVFIAAIDAMITLSQTYSEHFTKYFVDTVDILVGWHVDGSQSKGIKDFALQTLEKLSKHWQAGIQFSINLLSQFIEDMVSYSLDLGPVESVQASLADEIIPSSQECIQRITSFLNVFNTVAKSLGDLLNPHISKTVTWSFLTDSFEKVLNTLIKALAIEFDEDLILAGNECVYLFLGLLQTKLSSNSSLLYKLIDCQMDNCDILSDLEIISVLNVVSKIIKEISANLPIEFIQNIVGPKSSILNLRFTKSADVLYAIVMVYHNFLNLKNIPLLQEAYKCVLGDLENAYECFGHNFEVICRNNQFTDITYTLDEAEYVVLFHLQCLSDLANASNSIIGMWALQPSILELLAIKLNPHSEHLCRKYPAMQYAIIYLLYSHCKRNNHFVASSTLVNNGQHRANVCDILGISNLTLGEVSTTSPTSGHFAIILSLLKKMLDSVKTQETLLLTLKWISDIFSQLDQYLISIYSTKPFSDLIINMIHIGMSFDKQLSEAVAHNLIILMNIRNIPWNPVILNKIALLCIIHIDSNETNVYDKFLTLIVALPWDVVVSQISGMMFPKIENIKMVNNKLCLLNKVSMQKEYMMKHVSGQMSAQHFKEFMNHLLNSKGDCNVLLKDAFINCWLIENSHLDNAQNIIFKLGGLNFTSVITMWATWEAAHLCVSLKLRTPLGKPQETFMTIETAIKSLARQLTQNDYKSINLKGSVISKDVLKQQTRARLLIEFMDCLEKAIYNAADGTAFVMLSVPKPVRTFFHTNWMTCREWLSRVRQAALAVSLQMCHASAAVRHAYALLATNPSHAEPEVICLGLARALIKLQEPEALLGLYVWVKNNLDKKLPWLKAASDHANMRYEIAADNYKRLLNKKLEGHTKSAAETLKPEARRFPEETPSTSSVESVISIVQLDSREVQFIREQLSDCYLNIQNWSEMSNWTELSNHSSIIEYQCLDKYEKNEHVYLEELADWTVLDLKSESSNSILSYDILIKRVEKSLTYSAMQILYDRDNSNITYIEECESILAGLTKELIRNQPYELIREVNILHCVATAMKNTFQSKCGAAILRTSIEKQTLKNVDLNLLSKILWWSQYFVKIDPSEMNLFHLEKLRLDVIKSARKCGNLKWARNELETYFSSNSQFQALSSNNIKTLENLTNILVSSNNSYDLDIWSLNNSIALMETSKLLYSKEKSRHTAINICASISLGVSQRLAMGENSYDLRERGTRMLVTLSKWVQSEDEKILISNLNSPLTKLVTALPEIGLVINNVSENVISITDSAVGKLLQFSVNQCPSLAKAWSCFGSWCFRWGRKMVEYSSKTGEQLTENDKVQIQNIMMIGFNQKDFETVCEILSKTRASSDDDDINWDEINTSEMIENQLRSVPSLSNAYPEHISVLVNIWRQAQKRVFSYFELSADAYFKCLQLSSGSESNQHGGDCAIVTATLRLLRLIVKHAMELQNVLESGLANTPTQPWKVIIPQLFSRLNHPEAYVRRCVSELLCRLAEDVPHLIIFSAVVGAVENEKIDLSDISFPKSFMIEGNETEINDGNDNSDNESDKGIENDLNSCFMDMVETLSKQAPETVFQVQVLVQELQRINLLWDELWLGTMAQHNSEFTRRLSQLDIEVLKVKNNPHLKAEEKVNLISRKHRIIMQPIVFVFEQLYEVTSATPETPHEKKFQQKYQTFIKSIIDKLKNPLNPDKPQESWIPIKQLQSKLQQKANKRSSYILKMSDVSPVLANMKNTMISMPGVTANLNTRIIIRSVENNVAILPTKTKPKKLIFHGSDGKMYTYLFKGLEDLHLDERIMQFLSITNTMMARDKNDNEKQPYRARHYSVIPLGPRSGLISWVENVTPLFALYKRWQQREAAIVSVKTNKNVTVLRPSELFYGKLNPLLQTAGITNIENRKEWPISTLKKVLEELMSETPKDLLSKELWCGSVTPSRWWQTVRRYSYSVAVMSIIGYIIGLGDRHLDNVLVDLTYGEVVHIDYNVCFEKGKSLRVPEKVPFRMTPNLEHALGVTGVEGIFRLTCEHVLKVMKRGRETLLTLLEAFIYDPLVEWGGGGGAGGGGGVGPVGDAAAAGGACRGAGARARRRALERDCARDMFVVRCAEIRVEWDENKNEMLIHLPKVIEVIQKWLEDHKILSSSEARLQGCHQQMVLIKEVEAYGANLKNHPLYTISQRYMAYKQRKNAVDETMKGLVDTLAICKKQIEGHVMALDVINGPKVEEWFQELSLINDDDSAVFEVIKEFLTNAGQGNMIAQCEQSEMELNQFKRQQSHFIRTCLDLLSQYAVIVHYFPQSYLENHRSVLYSKWSSALLDSKSPEICREVMAQVHNLLAPESVNNPVIQQIVSFSYQLQTVYNDANAKLNKYFEKLQAEGGPDMSSVYDKKINDSKNSLSNFIKQENGAGGALECVTITTLCNLNRRYLMLEAGAQSAGDCLVDLTSREGDWFLDELNSISLLSMELMSLIPIDQRTRDDNVSVTFNCLKLANLIFKDLQAMGNNFQSIILPEAMRKIQAEDPTVLLMINELNAVIFNTPCPLNELMLQLERQLQYLIMAMELPASKVPAVIADLKMRYETFLNGSSMNSIINPVSFMQNGMATEDSKLDQSVNLQQSSGRMLLMGFDGLFKPLQIHSSDLADAVSALNIPPVWKKIDQVCDARDLAGHLLSDHLRSVVDDIFLVKRIQTMSTVFNLCVQMSCAFNGVGISAVYDEDILIKPVKRFMADYISSQFLGVHSLVLAQNICCLLQKSGLNITTEVEQKEIGASWKVHLEKLCEKTVENSLGGSKFSGNILSQASNLVGIFENAWRRRDSYQRLSRTVAAQRRSVHSIRLRITAHSWLHEDALALLPCNRQMGRGSRGQPAPPIVLHRQHFLAEIKKIITALLDIESKMEITLEKYTSLVASVQQRLKWAAGANPALQETLVTFQQRVNAFSASSLATEVPTIIAVAGGLLQHEIARTRTPEAVAGDRDFVTNVVRWEKACSMAAQCSLAITPIEESLMQLLHPEGAIDSQWVQNVSALIADMIQQLQIDMNKNKEKVLTVEESLKASANKLGVLMETHTFLISDAKTLLKTLSKFTDTVAEAVPRYVESHNVYFAILNSVVEGLTEEKLTEEKVAICNSKAIQLMDKTSDIYDNLLSLEEVCSTDQPISRRAALTRQSTVFGSESNGNGAVRQQRNAHAAGVWRRVRLKLEGRDSDLGPAKKNNQEQVDAIIKEAMSVDNLCLLYEGWTPWV